MDPKLVEELHEQASNAYLQGDVEGALTAWKAVLAADPADERAIEGIELCERLSGCEAGSVVTDGQSPFAVGGPPETAEPHPVDDSAEDLGDPLDDLLDMGDAPPPLPPSEELPDASASTKPDFGGLFDLSDLREDSAPVNEQGGFDVDELLSAPTGRIPARDGGLPDSLFDDDMPPAPPASRDEAESTWHFGVVPEENSEPSPPEPDDEILFGPKPTDAAPVVEEENSESPEPPPDESTEGPFVETPPEVNADEMATAGLHRRASELLATALAEMERGERDQALSTLERLLILDEQNEAARSLKAKLTLELATAEVPPSATDGENAPAATGGAFDPLDLEDEGGDALELDRAGAVEGEGSPAAAGGDPGAGSSADGAAPALDESGELREASQPVPGTAARRRFGLPVSRKLWLPAAAVLVLGLGFAAWQMFLGGASASGEEDRPVTQVEPPESRDSKPVPVPEPAAAPVEIVMTTEEKIAEFLRKADTAVAEADYAAAILSLNEALKLDPEHADSLARLESAAESYRIQQAKQQRWNQAVEDFDAGDYRAALAFFYRLPEDEHTPQVDRYLRNGWYNLGVTALKNRECDEALDHLGEARRLDTADAEVLEVTDLAMRCRREGSGAIESSLALLQYRGLEDSP